MATIAAGALVLVSSSFVSVATAEQVPVTVRIGDEPAPGAPPPQEPSAPAPQPPAPEAPAPGSDPDPGEAPPVVEGPPPAGEAPPPAGAPDPAPEPAEEPAPGPLPRTGSDALRLVRDAAAAIAVGLLLVLATRPSAPKELP